MDNCQNCVFYDEEYAYCFGFGFHAPLNGKCDKYQPKRLADALNRRRKQNKEDDTHERT